MRQSIKNQFKKHPYWADIKKAILKLSQNNFKTFIVGGAVRDALLNKTIKDIDLATSAKPKEIVKIFPKSNSSFAKYGVVFIPIKKGYKIEIASFREDSIYPDGRRPKSIKYSSMEKDAKRRDFTINALFYDLKTDKVIDLVNGIKDIKSKKIRTVGVAKKRFKEDHLRILRALRLAHQLNFKIDKQTQLAILKLNKTIPLISKERILEELTAMFSIGKINQSLKSLNDYGLFQQLFPQLKVEKKYFSFWKKEFSFYHDPAFYWLVMGLPFFYFNSKDFKDFLKTQPLKKTILKQALSYLNSVQTLTNLSSSFTDQLLAFNFQKNQVYELTYNFLESGLLKRKEIEETKKNLHYIFKEFEKREVKGQLPPALVTGSDILKMFPSIKKQNFSKIIRQAFELQMEKPKLNKTEILKKLDYS